MPMIVLTGASGAGKTAIATAVEVHRPGFADVFYFDRIGVPSSSDMAIEWGSGEAWQRAMTLRWMATIAASPASRARLLEGQMRLAFIREGLVRAKIVGAQIVLVDCDDDTRARRLMTDRNQPELVNQTTMDWAAFLRREAREGGDEVLDTSTITLEAAVDRVCALLRASSV